MKSPKVSVIIPAYNVQDYIGQSIQSALDQSFQDLEIVVVDDASTDKTVDVINTIEDPRVHLLMSKENFGPSYSRNIAIKKASGQWIALLDGDDWWEKNRLAKMLEVAEEHQADLVADDIKNYAEGENTPWNSTYLEKWNFPLPKWSVSAVDVIENDLGPLKPLIRRDFLMRNGLCYKEEITYGEDFVLLLECLLNEANMVIFQEPLYIRRAWANSLTAHRVRSTECLIELTKTLITRFKKEDYRQPEQLLQVIEALESRLKQQTDSYLYHQLTEPFKDGDILQAARQMVSLMLREPRSMAVVAGKVPSILDYRVLRHFRRP